eukprot:10386969-Alexandrium_andersonii.AAC.1
MVRRAPRKETCNRTTMSFPTASAASQSTRPSATSFGGALITITCEACMLSRRLGTTRWRCGWAGPPTPRLKVGPAHTSPWFGADSILWPPFDGQIWPGVTASAEQAAFGTLSKEGARLKVRAHAPWPCRLGAILQWCKAAGGVDGKAMHTAH